MSPISVTFDRLIKREPRGCDRAASGRRDAGASWSRILRCPTRLTLHASCDSNDHIPCVLASCVARLLVTASLRCAFFMPPICVAALRQVAALLAGRHTLSARRGARRVWRRHHPLRRHWQCKQWPCGPPSASRVFSQSLSFCRPHSCAIRVGAWCSFLCVSV